MKEALIPGALIVYFLNGSSAAKTVSAPVRARKGDRSILKQVIANEQGEVIDAQTCSSGERVFR